MFVAFDFYPDPRNVTELCATPIPDFFTNVSHCFETNDTKVKVQNGPAVGQHFRSAENREFTPPCWAMQINAQHFPASMATAFGD